MANKKLKGSLAIGIDLGGTKIAAGLVNDKGRLLYETRRPTVVDPEHSTPAKHIRYVVTAMANSVDELVTKIPGTTPTARRAQLRAIGLASAGPMNVLTGQLINPSNFKGWKTVAITSLLQKELLKRGYRATVHFQNDAIAAALAEGWIGAAKKLNTYVMVTLGTGIGSGVILNGRPAQSGGMGSEWGHMLVDISALQADPEQSYHVEVEGLSSGTGLKILAEKAGLQINMMRDLAVLSKNGDKKAQEIFAKSSYALAMLFYNLSLGLHVEKILVTGGLMHIQDVFLPQAVSIYNELISAKNVAFKAPVAHAKLGNEAGIIGAARLAFMEH